MNLGQLKILQEVIAPTAFVPFAALSMQQPLKLNHRWAALCIPASLARNERTSPGVVSP